MIEWRAALKVAVQQGAIGLLGPDILEDIWKMGLNLWAVNLCLGGGVLINMIIERTLTSLCVLLANWISLVVHVYWLRNQKRYLILAENQAEMKQIGEATTWRLAIMAGMTAVAIVPLPKITDAISKLLDKIPH